MKEQTKTTKLPAHFVNARYNDDIDQVLDYKKLINHNKKEIQDWW